MESVLIVYGSRTGCTAQIAQRIADVLRESSSRVIVAPAERAPSPSGFEAVLVGSGVRAMRWYEPVIAYAEDHAEQLKDVPLAFFSVGLTPVRFPELEKRIAAYAFSLLVHTGVTPTFSGNFKGCFDPSRLTLPEIAVVRAMGVPEGDYREWDVIDAWAHEAAARLAASVPVGASRR